MTTILFSCLAVKSLLIFWLWCRAERLRQERDTWKMLFEMNNSERNEILRELQQAREWNEAHAFPSSKGMEGES